MELLVVILLGAAMVAACLATVLVFAGRRGLICSLVPLCTLAEVLVLAEEGASAEAVSFPSGGTTVLPAGLCSTSTICLCWGFSGTLVAVEPELIFRFLAPCPLPLWVSLSVDLLSVETNLIPVFAPPCSTFPPDDNMAVLVPSLSLLAGLMVLWPGSEVLLDAPAACMVLDDVTEEEVAAEGCSIEGWEILLLRE